MRLLACSCCCCIFSVELRKERNGTTPTDHEHCKLFLIFISIPMILSGIRGFHKDGNKIKSTMINIRSPHLSAPRSS